jgi:putative transposase
MDAWVVMPDHVHGILWIEDHSLTLGRVIGLFKAAATRDAVAAGAWETGTIWQRGFYDRIIRDEEELNRLRRYIALNPSRWTGDQHS